MILPNSALTVTSTYLKAEIALLSILPCHLPNQPPKQIFNWFLNLQIYWIKQLKYLQEHIDLATLKKFLSKDDPSKSPNSKSISSENTVFK